jgi:hypothetical protein
MTREAVFAAILIVAGLSSWGVGMWNFLAIGKTAGISYRGALSAFQIYKHAFTTMRRSRQTKWMVIGFVGMLGFPAIIAIVSVRLGLIG